MILSNLLFGHQAVLYVFAGCWQLDSFFNASSCVIWVRTSQGQSFHELCWNMSMFVCCMAWSQWQWRTGLVHDHIRPGSGAGIVGHVVDAQDLMISGTCCEFPLSAVVPVRSVFGYCLFFLVLFQRADRYNLSVQQLEFLRLLKTVLWNLQMLDVFFLFVFGHNMVICTVRCETCWKGADTDTIAKYFSCWLQLLKVLKKVSIKKEKNLNDNINKYLIHKYFRLYMQYFVYT